MGGEQLNSGGRRRSQRTVEKVKKKRENKITFIAGSTVFTVLIRII